jgi:hypothetical protein
MGVNEGGKVTHFWEKIGEEEIYGDHGYEMFALPHNYQF